MRFLKSDKKYKMFQDSGSFNTEGLAMAGLAAGAGFLESRRQKKMYEGIAADEADRYKQHEGLYKKTLKDLMDTGKYGREEMSVSQGAAEARDAAIESSKALVDQARNKGEQDTASILNILDGGDPATAALAVSQMDDISGGITEANQKALNMANQAEAMYGAEKAKIDQYNVGVRDDNRSRLAALANLELQRGAGGMDPDRELQARMSAEGTSPLSDALASGISAYSQYAEQGMRFVGDEGGITESTTNGDEFSHDRNPVHLIDKDGQKVGEVTGGEYILNPKHSGIIKKLVDAGDAYGLLDFLDELLSQPRFK